LKIKNEEDEQPDAATAQPSVRRRQLQLQLARRVFVSTVDTGTA